MKKNLAKYISNILNQFLISFIIIILLTFESTNSISEALKWILISVALSVLPVLIVVIYLVRIHKLDGVFINPRRQRYKIYLLASTMAVIGCVIMLVSGAPRLLLATFIAGLAAIFTFMFINLIWKISLHTAFIAASVTILTIVYGLTGAWTVVLLPLVAWARIKLKLHSPAQVVAGTLLATAIVVIVFAGFGMLSGLN